MSIPRPHPVCVSVVGGLATALLLLSAGCADMATDVGLMSQSTAQPAELERQPPITSTGHPAAVLSIHTRKSYPDACKFGMTLTNNLSFPITALAFRLTAIIGDNVAFEAQTKDFSQLRPSDQQYREIVFQGVKCSQIKRIEVSDPGRCTLDALNRFNANAGDCAKFSEVAGGRLINVVKVKSPPRPASVVPDTVSLSSDPVPQSTERGPVTTPSAP